MDYDNKLRDRLKEAFLADRDGFLEIDQDRLVFAMLDKDWEEIGWEPHRIHKERIERILEMKGE